MLRHSRTHELAAAVLLAVLSLPGKPVLHLLATSPLQAQFFSVHRLSIEGLLTRKHAARSVLGFLAAREFEALRLHPLDPKVAAFDAGLE
jgi:hypothetical protein